MHTRNLSPNFTVSSIGYGAMGLSEFYGKQTIRLPCSSYINLST